MNVSRNVAEIIGQHVTLEVESIDRMYLNLYVPRLQHDGGVVGFFRDRDQPFASAHVMAEITRKFVASLEAYAKAQNIPVVTFQKGQRKDDIAADYRARFNRAEGVVFIGKSQERASVFRTEKRFNRKTGRSYPWLVRTTASSTTKKDGPCVPRPPSITPRTFALANGSRTCRACARSATLPTDVCLTSNN
jgi:hypothetical protein